MLERMRKLVNLAIIILIMFLATSASSGDEKLTFFVEEKGSFTYQLSCYVGYLLEGSIFDISLLYKETHNEIDSAILVACGDGDLAIAKESSLIEFANGKNLSNGNLVMLAAMPISSDNYVIICRNTLTEELGYKLANAFWSNIEDFKQLCPEAEKLTMKYPSEIIDHIPIHNGAKYYYKSLGLE